MSAMRTGFVFSMVMTAGLCLSGCQFLETVKTEKQPPIEAKAEIKLDPVHFSDLPEWQADKQKEALAAFAKSCDLILKRDASRRFGPENFEMTYADWQPACQNLRPYYLKNDLFARAYFETYFTPYLVHENDDPNGLFTGYYEPSLNGSYTKSEKFNIPLYQIPDDMVTVELGNFIPDLKGKKITGRVEEGKFTPYFNHEDIDKGALAERNLELIYVDSKIDAFFLHIQGSGRIKMDDGTDILVGYAGQNGHKYFAIGRALIEQGHLTKENVSLQSIRQWLLDNPDEADKIMQLNPSYVFFQKLESENPKGGSGLELTPHRSLAVDHRLMPYHVPMFLSVGHPTQTDQQITQLMIAQDTGGAIRGHVRGDFFWGHGAEAEENAGKMKEEGRYWMLLPRKLEIPTAMQMPAETPLKKFWLFASQ